MNLNKVLLIGNLTRDPEARNLPSGQAVSSFGLATNRIWNDRETGERKKQVEFHNIVAFGKLAEICNQYLNKGKMVYIEGRLQTHSWEDQGGTKKYRTEIIAEKMQMGPKFGAGTGEGEPKTPGATTAEELPVEDVGDETEGKSSSAKSSKKGSKNKKDTPTEKEEEIDVKDIPF